MIYLPYIGGLMAIFWGVAHIAATNPVIRSFGALSIDNKRILAMEWIVEGISLCLIGTLVLLSMILGKQEDVLFQLILIMCAVALFLFAGLALFTGARTKQLPFRVCPFIEMGAGILVFAGIYS